MHDDIISLCEELSTQYSDCGAQSPRVATKISKREPVFLVVVRMNEENEEPANE